MLSSSHGFSSQAPVLSNLNGTLTMETSNSSGAIPNIPFPVKLRAMLEEAEAKGLSHIVSWEMEGTAFRVHEPDEFVKRIMGYWFNQTKYKSFQRQLNLYGFNRVSRGPQKGCYVHEKFQRNQPKWTESIYRKKISDEDFTESELIAPSWLPDATRSVLEPTPIRDTQRAPRAMMDAFEAYFQTKVVAKVSSSPPSSAAATSKNLIAVDSSKGPCTGNALQRFLDKVLETDDSSSKPHAVAHDDETDTKDHTTTTNSKSHPKRSSRCAVFPDKLHDMLEYCETKGLHSLCSWEMDGRAFRIQSIDLFAEQVMPKFFKLTKFESLQRQLNLYSFTRISRGPMKGCYYHPLFVKGGRDLSKDMQRRKPDDCSSGMLTLSVPSPDLCKSLVKKRKISISESETTNNKSNKHQEIVPSTCSGTRGDATFTMAFVPTNTCSRAVCDTSEDDDALDMMARDCFGAQSYSGAVSMSPSQSLFHLHLSNAMAMGMTTGTGGVSRMPVPTVSPQGMVLSTGWDPSVVTITGNHTTMNLGDAAFSLPSQAS